jgi:hypothetical protein
MTKMSIVIELPHPDGHRIDCEGIVVRCDPHEIGDDRFKVAILFSKISDADHEAVVEYVEHDLAQPELVE